MNNPTTVAGERPPNPPETPRQGPPDYILHAAEVSQQIARQGGRGSPGRKFGPEPVLKLLMAIRDGMYYEPACRLAGVSYESFHHWMNRADDEADDGPYATFASAVKVAAAEAEHESLGYVRAAARDPRFWAAGMTFLERRYADRWKRQDGPTVSVQVGIAVGMPGQGLAAPQLPALSPVPTPLSALSPASEIAVSADASEAKATPIEGVSPVSVA